MHLQSCFDFGSEIGQGRRRQLEEVLVRGILKLFPAKSMHHSSFNPIRLAGMPVVVKAPDDEAMLLDEGALRGEDGIAFSFRKIGCLIQMVKEGRLMCD